MKLLSFLLLVSLPPLLGAQDCTQRVAEDFAAMTTSERLVNAADSVAGPRALVEVGVRAAVDHGADRQREWGRGGEGFGWRVGNAWAQRFIGQVVEQSVAFRLHEDNRYFASGTIGVAHRFGYAAASTVLARHDDGSRSISYSVIAGAAASAFVARTWQPRSTSSVGDAAVSFGLTLGIRGLVNVAREFCPPLLRFMLK